MRLSRRYIAIREELAKCNEAINYYNSRHGLSNYEQCCLEVMHNRRKYLLSILEDQNKPYGEKIKRRKKTKDIPKIPKSIIK